MINHRGGPVAGGDLLDRLDEFLTLAEFLEVEDDDRRVEVLVEVEEQIQFIDIRLVADGDELREAEIPVRGKIEDGGAERPALGDERDVPAGGHPLGEARVQADVGKGVDHAEAVGADEADLGLLAEGDDPVFDLQPFAADLAETGGDDHDPLDPLFDGLLHRLEAGLRRQDDDGEIDTVGDRSDRGKGLHAQNRLGLGIDRIEGPLETALEDVGKDVMPDLAGGIGGADDGNGFRGKNCIKTVHDLLFPFTCLYMRAGKPVR